ncbi:type VI secretion system baseplate subunit TssE [uncultured Litoreibacter sp.]|uniref:type VI secretion system baseplate subunit TssE n=1 Tax=uncultured Litoreibacter sp. TaxID=1392394 RepID=UPI0026025B0A|nr:type VI secretion system baseplate subunit TssE [uncultured Litoreibacter sp.]
MRKPYDLTVPPNRDPSRSNQRQVSLMHVFRASAESGDARKDGKDYQDGDRSINVRAKQRREGVDESELRRHLNADLNNLMNTIRLDATVELEDHPRVEKSVLNFGFADMSSLTQSHLTDQKIATSIRESLINHEPRLIPDSIEVVIRKDDRALTQQVAFDISAEMVADPVDIPLDFVAEVDLGAGKMVMKRLRVQT